MSNTLTYKNYVGTVNFSGQDGVFYGKIAGISDSISFEGDSVASLTQDFHDAIDEYLEFCEKNGKQPQQQYKGSFNVRISPELHRQASLIALEKHISLNNVIEQSVKNYVVQNTVR